MSGVVVQPDRAAHLNANRAPDVPEAPENSGCCGMTRAKAQKVGLAILAALLFAAAIVVVVLSAMNIIPIIGFFVAVPLIIGGAFAIWAICRIKDYEDPASLAQYRAQAQNRDFAATIADHGLDNIFKYRIVAPQTFADRCRAHFRDLPLNRCLDLTEEMQRHYQQYRADAPAHAPTYQIPDARELQGKFIVETRGLDVARIFDNFDIERLVRHRILSERSPRTQALRAAYPIYQQMRRTSAHQRDLVEQRYQAAVQPLQAHVQRLREMERQQNFQRDLAAAHHSALLAGNPNNPHLQAQVDHDRVARIHASFTPTPSALAYQRLNAQSAVARAEADHYHRLVDRCEQPPRRVMNDYYQNLLRELSDEA
jgi:hypothetical protein